MTYVKCIAKKEDGTICGHFWDQKGFLWIIKCPKCGAVDKVEELK